MTQSLPTGPERSEREREAEREGGREESKEGGTGRREIGKKEERVKQKYAHYSTLAAEEGAPDFLGNMLMTLF